MCMLCAELTKMTLKEVIGAFAEIKMKEPHLSELSDKIVEEFGAENVKQEIIKYHDSRALFGAPICKC